MEQDNQLHLSIDTLESIVKQAKEERYLGHNMSNIVRITKTSTRQNPDLEDGISLELLTLTNG